MFDLHLVQVCKRRTEFESSRIFPGGINLFGLVMISFLIGILASKWLFIGLNVELQWCARKAASSLTKVSTLKYAHCMTRSFVSLSSV